MTPKRLVCGENKPTRKNVVTAIERYSGTMRALGSEDLQAHGFESCPRSECRLGFLTQGNGFLAGGLSDRRYPKKYPL
ncbi:hypothetical protein E2C01_067100 [Portunus trituberculatus]|uniref:Uncharacterized protein n=1 Tax=Portunus trituberculatus TaxID=210409 RepID=A0A5B7HU48_PORTR|nr:hypothetical protein [Portunus trituberculatus]